MHLTKSLLKASVLTALLGTASVSLEIQAAETPSVVAQGKEIAFDRKRGNCLACHMVEDGAAPGNIGPPLVSMKLRYPDKAKLHTQIYDATQANPNTMMPPFGKHGILTPEDLDKVVEYIYTL